MLSLHKCSDRSSNVLKAPATLTESRFKPEYFTRNRIMPFLKVLKFLISMMKVSTQCALNLFFEEEGITMSQQALSKARNKFNHTPFLKVFEAIRDMMYDEENSPDLERYEGMIVIAIDGSQTPLPNIPKLRKKYGGTGSKRSSPTARASIAYDVTNDFIMDADFVPLSVGERTLAMQHIKKVGEIIDLKEALFILDRGYPCEDLIRELSEKSHYLMRLRRKFSKDIDELGLGSHIITLYGDVKARIVKLELPSGEIETLITNLFDLDESKFMGLYFMRWPVEVKYDIVKNKLELPNFGGFTENVIMQDFWISMYLLNMAAVAKHEADVLIKQERAGKNNKYEYQANVNTVIGSLRNRLADAVFFSDEAERDRKLLRIIAEIQRSVIPIRPDSNVVRYCNPRKTKFHHNKKSNV